jgi:hypothetical protein
MKKGKNNLVIGDNTNLMRKHIYTVYIYINPVFREPYYLYVLYQTKKNFDVLMSFFAFYKVSCICVGDQWANGLKDGTVNLQH